MKPDILVRAGAQLRRPRLNGARLYRVDTIRPCCPFARESSRFVVTATWRGDEHSALSTQQSALSNQHSARTRQPNPLWGQWSITLTAEGGCAPRSGRLRAAD